MINKGVFTHDVQSQMFKHILGDIHHRLDEERVRALCLSQGLVKAQLLFQCGERNCSALIAAAARIIEAAGGQTDYIECVDPDALSPVKVANQDTRMLMAVYIGRTRLIDNGALGA